MFAQGVEDEFRSCATPEPERGLRHTDQKNRKLPRILEVLVCLLLSTQKAERERERERERLHSGSDPGCALVQGEVPKPSKKKEKNRKTCSERERERGARFASGGPSGLLMPSRRRR